MSGTILLCHVCSGWHAILLALPLAAPSKGSRKTFSFAFAKLQALKLMREAEQHSTEKAQSGARSRTARYKFAGEKNDSFLQAIYRVWIGNETYFHYFQKQTSADPSLACRWPLDDAKEIWPGAVLLLSLFESPTESVAMRRGIRGDRSSLMGGNGGTVVSACWVRQGIRGVWSDLLLTIISVRLGVWGGTSVLTDCTVVRAEWQGDHRSPE